MTALLTAYSTDASQEIYCALRQIWSDAQRAANNDKGSMWRLHSTHTHFMGSTEVMTAWYNSHCKMYIEQLSNTETMVHRISMRYDSVVDSE